MDDMHHERVRDARHPDTGDAEDFSYGRVRRLLDLVRGEAATAFSGSEGFEEFSSRAEPHSPGLRTPRSATPAPPRRRSRPGCFIAITSAPPTKSPRACARPAFAEIDEVAFALPFSFEHDD
jgi:hypothetical protein